MKHVAFHWDLLRSFDGRLHETEAQLIGALVERRGTHAADGLAHFIFIFFIVISSFCLFLFISHFLKPLTKRENLFELFQRKQSEKE